MASRVHLAGPPALWVQRGVLVLAALGAILWLAGSYRSEDAITDGSHALQHHDLTGGGAAFDRARAFGSDAEVDRQEVIGLFGIGQYRRALPLALRATRLEPDNFDSWFGLYAITVGRYPAVARRASRRAAALDPDKANRLRTGH